MCVSKLDTVQHVSIVRATIAIHRDTCICGLKTRRVTLSHCSRDQENQLQSISPIQWQILHALTLDRRCDFRGRGLYFLGTITHIHTLRSTADHKRDGN